MNEAPEFTLQDPLATTPSKTSKKDKKEKKQKKNAVNGDHQENNDRASPEVNSQEQNAAQRASGGVIDAPPEVNHYLLILSEEGFK